jgi:hypothetical protein
MIKLLPMMQLEELNLLEKYLDKEKVICEYGSGGSTNWLSERTKFVYSIEHNKEWYDKTKSSLSNRENVEIFYVPSFNWDPSTEGNIDSFENYINMPGTLNIDFSFFLVDGRARVDCCRFISKKFPTAIIAFHDYTNRANDVEHNYSRVLEHLTLIETCKTLAIFKKKV